jgi:hypothetical protein
LYTSLKREEKGGFGFWDDPAKGKFPPASLFKTARAQRWEDCLSPFFKGREWPEANTFIHALGSDMGARSNNIVYSSG